MIKEHCLDRHISASCLISGWHSLSALISQCIFPRTCIYRINSPQAASFSGSHSFFQPCFCQACHGSAFASASNCRHPRIPWDGIQMCKFCSEQEWGIRIELLGKVLVLCGRSTNRAKSRSPAMWERGWGSTNCPSHLCGMGQCSAPAEGLCRCSLCLVVPWTSGVGTPKSFSGVARA